MFYDYFTLKLIIDHYPIESIKDTGGFFKGPVISRSYGSSANHHSE